MKRDRIRTNIKNNLLIPVVAMDHTRFIPRDKIMDMTYYVVFLKTKSNDTCTYYQWFDGQI